MLRMFLQALVFLAVGASGSANAAIMGGVWIDLPDLPKVGGSSGSSDDSSCLSVMMPRQKVYLHNNLNTTFYPIACSSANRTSCTNLTVNPYTTMTLTGGYSNTHCPYPTPIYIWFNTGRETKSYRLENGKSYDFKFLDPTWDIFAR